MPVLRRQNLLQRKSLLSGSKGASRAHPHLRSLHVFTRAQRTRVHFCPRHWLLCHLGLYKFEFEFDITRRTRVNFLPAISASVPFGVLARV
jgi:hypothetical protein